MSLAPKPVAILGAGLAGLTVAHHLRSHGVPVALFEANSKIAGLATSHRDPDGFTYDFGAHFITNRLAKTIGVADQCRDVPRYAETVRLRGRSYSHPFGLMRVPRFLLSALKQKSPLKKKHPPQTAADWYRAQYGRALADEVAIPLTEAWSGVPADQLSTAVGDGISSGVARTLYLKLAGKWNGKAVACGYSHELPETPGVWHVYPTGGIGLLCEKLAADLTDVIRLESPVQGVVVEDGRVVAVQTRGVTHEVSAAVSTAPLPALAKMVRGTDALEPLSRFRYRPMVFVNLRLDGRGLLPDVVTWTPETQFPFFRLTETPLSMPWLAPEGKTLITVDIGCEVGDEVWSRPDDALAEMCLGPLAEIIPDVRRRYQGCRVLKTPFAYPVFKLEYEAERRAFRDRGTGVAGLYSVGRNGEFMHIFMEDVHCRAIRTAERILKTI